MTNPYAYHQNGRLVLDEDPAPPSDPPPLQPGLDEEGADLDEELDLDEEELIRLEAVIEESIRQLARGEHYTADEVMKCLRSARNPHLVLDEEPAHLSDRPPLHLGLGEEGVELDEEELSQLEAVIEESIQQLDRGEGIDAREALAQMWALLQ
jgi:hypothetical protein